MSFCRFSISSRILFFLVAGSCAGSEVLTVATFNVQNYLIEDRMVEGRWRSEYPKPEKERDAVRNLIRRYDPDVLVIQEMGDMPFLEELQQDLELEGLAFPHRYVHQGEDEVRHLALLSKEPFTVERTPVLDFKYFDSRIPVKRGLLEARFETGGHAWTLYGVHLKSRYTSNREDPQSVKRRTGEAQAIRDYIRSKYPPESEPSYLVVGDFNDTRGSATLRRLLEVSGRTLTELVPAADSRGETWTHYFSREDVYSRVDFILASPRMMQALVPDSGVVVDDPEALQASDHRMVLARFSFPPASLATASK